MFCSYFSQSLCRSCPNIAIDYARQIEAKQSALKDLLQLDDDRLLSPVTSPEAGFRNKAKMVVLGVAQAPILGIEHPDSLDGIPLTHCPLYPESMQALLQALPEWIRNAGIPPYNRHKRRGELKFVLLSQSLKTGHFMLRFVLHSEKCLERIERYLPDLKALACGIDVISVNIQPVHMARLEGEKEIFLTEQKVLEDEFNHTPLFIKPKSFFQTNPSVAQMLYRTAALWVKENGAKHIWDLFCGVGGFALHCAPFVESVTGIEIEPEAIACATLSAQKMGVTNLKFAALDSAEFSASQEQSPDLVIVNPPRRGLGKALIERLNALAPQTLMYSSCNPHSLADDLQLLDYDIVRVQGFDMFPHTEHMEVLLELRRRP